MVKIMVTKLQEIEKQLEQVKTKAVQELAIDGKVSISTRAKVLEFQKSHDNEQSKQTTGVVK